MIDAFSRLRKPGLVTKDVFGNELYANTPEQKDADFNTVANHLLTSDAMQKLNSLRKGIGEYPSVSEIINLMEKDNDLTEKDLDSFESFIPYYKQLEVHLSPTKVKWLK